ncbi:cts1p [Diplodia corticola]|uniref:Cts1p n=1 Tax=Diplodia corticola TaxID=236234 RepID=A0A1J9S188_9PEZI|nr:cts1p [Diplodia corticola]OJD34351.1 cts1p [Diplodia corticola]
MLGSILPLLLFPFAVSSHASPVRAGIHPGHGGAPAPAMPPPLEPPSYYSSALPTPTSIPNHDTSPQKPLNGNPADLEVPQHPVVPSPSAAAGLAIYYGTSPSSPEDPSLVHLCADDSISTILLGHVHGFKPTNGFPIVDFAAAGCTTKHADDDRLAPGLAWCPELGRQVQTCQTRGKKVFLSLGGSPHGNSTLSFVDAADARRAAVMLWSLFGQGNPHGPDMRPLGEAAVDGFDFAWTTTPSSSSSSVQAFADTLRTLSDMRKNYKPSHLSRTSACTTDDDEVLRDVIDVSFATADAGPGKVEGCASPYRRTLGA